MTSNCSFLNIVLIDRLKEFPYIGNCIETKKNLFDKTFKFVQFTDQMREIYNHLGEENDANPERRRLTRYMMYNQWFEE